MTAGFVTCVTVHARAHSWTHCQCSEQQVSAWHAYRSVAYNLKRNKVAHTLCLFTCAGLLHGCMVLQLCVRVLSGLAVGVLHQSGRDPQRGPHTEACTRAGSALLHTRRSQGRTGAAGACATQRLHASYTSTLDPKPTPLCCPPAADPYSPAEHCQQHPGRLSHQ